MKGKITIMLDVDLLNELRDTSKRTMIPYVRIIEKGCWAAIDEIKAKNNL